MSIPTSSKRNNAALRQDHEGDTFTFPEMTVFMYLFQLLNKVISKLASFVVLTFSFIHQSLNLVDVSNYGRQQCEKTRTLKSTINSPDIDNIANSIEKQIRLIHNKTIYEIQI